MKPRALLSAVLLLFVASSVGYLIFGDPEAAPAQDGSAAGTATPTALPVAPSANDRAVAPAPEAPRRFVAWYLHGSMRCRTCRTIEQVAEEAVTVAFAGDLRDGRLVWRTSNFEDAAIAPLAERFGVTGSSLVVTEWRGDEVLRHRLLPKVWDLVDDRQGLMEYVVEEIDGFMAGLPAGAADGAADGAAVGTGSGAR